MFLSQEPAETSRWMTGCNLQWMQIKSATYDMQIRCRYMEHSYSYSLVDPERVSKQKHNQAKLCKIFMIGIFIFRACYVLNDECIDLPGCKSETHAVYPQNGILEIPPIQQIHQVNNSLSILYITHPDSSDRLLGCGYTAATPVRATVQCSCCRVPSKLLQLAVAAAVLRYMRSTKPVRGIWIC